MSTSNYDLVQAYFENTGVECWECPHFSSWTEPHGERLTECALLVEDNADMCPALDDLIAEAEQDDAAERSEEGTREGTSEDAASSDINSPNEDPT